MAGLMCQVPLLASFCFVDFILRLSLHGEGAEGTLCSSGLLLSDEQYQLDDFGQAFDSE